MKSLLAENLPKSALGSIVRFFEPGATYANTGSSCIILVFNSYILLIESLRFELFNRRPI